MIKRKRYIFLLLMGGMLLLASLLLYLGIQGRNSAPSGSATFVLEERNDRNLA